MNKVFVLMGKSCAGKDTILKELMKRGHKTVVSYTTRPKRKGETDGVEYRFVTMERFTEMVDADEFVEYRSYKSESGVRWWYALPRNGFDLEKESKVVIVELFGLEQIKHAFGEENVVSIFINTEGRERLMRSLKRQPFASDEEVGEMCRRYLSDEEDFSYVYEICDCQVDSEGFEDSVAIINQIIKMETK